MACTRRNLLVIIVGVVLAFAGAATAAVLTKTITLHGGQCVKVAKTKVCAAKVVAHTVTGPASTTVTSNVTVTAPPPPPAVAFRDGTFRVGTDIQAGTYQTPGGPSCYWARLSGFSGGLDDVIANDFAGSTIVAISSGDLGFESKNCGTWTKIG